MTPERRAELLEQQMTPWEQELQRRSFAYGNTHLSNPNITREMVEKASWEMDQAKIAELKAALDARDAEIERLRGALRDMFQYAITIEPLAQVMVARGYGALPANGTEVGKRAAEVLGIGWPVKHDQLAQPATEVE